MKRIMGVLILLSVILPLNISRGYAFELNGFADVSFTKSTEGGEEFRNGDFAFGTLDLYLAQSLEDVEILVELIVEKGDVLDLERLNIGYTFNDALKVRAGRFHTPLGFWNTAYHHGVQLQPTILRPEFLNFEDDGGIIPVHIVGVFFSGRARTTAGVLEYGATVGNGPVVTAPEEGGANVIFPNNISDNSIGKAIALNVAFSPAMLQGLKVGVSGHRSRIQSDASVIDVDGDTVPETVDEDQTILGAALMYSIANVGIMGEYFSIKDEDNAVTDAGSNTSNAYYGLLTYTYQDKWVPYLLYEKMEIEEEDDPYFISLGTEDSNKLTAGLRYNISYRSSVKGEFRAVEKGEEDWNEYSVQWALAF